MNEVTKFKIVKKDGSDLELCYITPDSQHIAEADQIYAAKIAEIIRRGGPTKPLLRAEVEDFIKNQSTIWSKEDDDELEKLRSRLADLLSKLKKGGSKLSEARKWALEVLDLRSEIVKYSAKKQTLYSATIESIADAERNDYLIYIGTVYDHTHERYWPSFDDMKNDKDSQIYLKAHAIFYKIVYGIDGDFEKNLPEVKWLKKYGFIDDDMNLIDKNTGEYVDRDGRPIKEIENEIIDQISLYSGEILEESPFVDDISLKKDNIDSEVKTKGRKRKQLA